MLLAIGNNGQFARFCEAAGHADWASDPRFATNTLRVRHREVLIPQMEAVTRTRTTAEWIALLEDKAVPCGPINDIAQAFDDEQVKARGLAVTPAARCGRRHRRTSSASRARCACQATPPVLRHAPPALGQHTDEVLAEMGVDEKQRAALRAAGVLCERACGECRGLFAA